MNCCDRDGWIQILRLVFRLALRIRWARLRDWAQEAKRQAVGLRHGPSGQAW